jgi:hypothetical protein
MKGPFLPWGLIAALILAVIVGATTLDGGFVYDDLPAILENPLVQGEVPAREAFQRSFWGKPLAEESFSYRPLSPLLWRGIWKISPGNPWPFRFFSLLLHAAAVLLFWRAGRLLDVEEKLLTAAALLFAVSPAHSESVGAIVGQADVLGACLGLGALILCARATAARTALAAALILLLACLAKESSFLFAAPCLWVLLLRDDLGPGRKIGYGAPLAIIALSVVILQLSFERGTDHWNNSLTYGASGWTRLLLGLYLIGRIFVFCIAPHHNAPAHGYAGIDLSTDTLAGYAVVGVIAIALLCFALGLAFKKQQRAAGVLCLMMLGPLILVSGLIVHMPADFPERIMYPATMAASGLMASLLFRKLEGGRRTFFLTLLVFAFLAANTVAQRPWRSAAALWEHAVMVEPKVIRVQHNLADVRRGQGRIPEAAWHRLLAAYVNDRYPSAVDWSPVQRMEREMSPLARIAEAPSILTPENPCRLVTGVLDVYRRTLWEFNEEAARIYSRRHPECFENR